jgi:hypothetical protein
MRTSVTILGGAALLAFGYVLGASHILSPAAALGQEEADKAAAAAATGVEVTEETKTKIKAAATALKVAMDALVDEGKYTAATKGVNCFGVLSGGVHAIRDLERNAVVDPETYAALYANLATDTVAADLGRDENGNLTYKHKVIRIYPVSAIRGKYAIRADITGEELLPAAPDEAAAKAKK